MQKESCPHLSHDVETLLTEEGNKRLTEDEDDSLRAHLTMICGWADRVPAYDRVLLCGMATGAGGSTAAPGTRSLRLP